MSKRTSTPRLILALTLPILLAGCGGTDSRLVSAPPPPVSGFTGLTIAGQVFTGSTPLAGAGVQLYAAGTSGNGSAPTSLGAPSTSDNTGSFTISAGYTCPSGASQLYLVARGPADHQALTLAVMLGRCDAVAASTKFILNEVTTAATVWALSQFLAPGGSIGASATNTAGLANAAAIAMSLAGNTTGTSPGLTFPANATSPAPRINSLANLLSLCSGPGGASAALCGELVALANPASSSSTNTLDLALNLVRNPGANAAALFNLSQKSSAFLPAMPSAPADWTLALTFRGAGLNEPGPLALDSGGNLWVASYFGVVSEFSPTGDLLFPSGLTGSGLSESYGLAIAPSGSVWITDESSPTAVNSALGSVTVLSGTGQPISGVAGFSSGGLNYPVAIAIDPNGTAWVIDYGNSHLTQLSPSGQPLSGASGYFSNQLDFPVAIALDASHNAWIANMGGSTVTRVSPDGEQFSSYTCCNAPAGLSLDPAGNVWVANYLGDSVSELSPNGTVLSAGYTGGGLLHPQGIAVDSAGTVWVANFRGNSITELAGAGSAQPGRILSPAAGWAPTSTSLQPFAIAIDSSGNLWISNFADNSVTEIIGLAAPVKTPLLGPPQLP